MFLDFCIHEKSCREHRRKLVSFSYCNLNTSIPTNRKSLGICCETAKLRIQDPERDWSLKFDTVMWTKSLLKNIPSAWYSLITNSFNYSAALRYPLLIKCHKQLTNLKTVKKTHQCQFQRQAFLIKNNLVARIHIFYQNSPSKLHLFYFQWDLGKVDKLHFDIFISLAQKWFIVKQ